VELELEFEMWLTDVAVGQRGAHAPLLPNGGC